ncbi:MAG: hypothetical protein GY913_03740 [Proteobacteria bacterium]|nr:hypothetical protein [Pseudomonadota bacterium]MCP4916014.1 hypothetical protein [Pseudomonadota bacterium]
MSARRDVLTAAGIALALALLLTWPVVLDPFDSMIGHPGNDTWNHAWGYWWLLDGVVSNGALPSHTDLLNYPDGGSLFFIDAFNAIWSMPLAIAGGVPLAVNAVVIAGFFWNAFGAWLLGRYVLRDKWLAWVPAVIFASSAHLLGQTYNGITETSNAGWIPFYLWTLLRLMDRPTWKRAALLGAALAICSISNFYYGLFGVVASVIFVLHRLIREPRRVLWWRFAVATIGGAVLYAAMVLPVLQALQSSIDAADAMVNRDPEFVWESLLNHNITDLVSMFRPGRVYSPDLKAEYGEDLLIIVYLGWTALVLAVVGLWQHRPRRDLSLWLAMLVIFAVFALGPFLYVGGDYLRYEGQRVPLPFLVFFKAFPLFERISHPFRFVVPATIGLGMLAGFGVKELGRRFTLDSRIAAGGATALILVELLALSPAPWPLPRCDAEIPAVYAELSGGAVLDLPITVPNLERAVYTWYQTSHGLPSPYGLNDPIPAPLAANPLTGLLVQVEASRTGSLPHLLPDLELVAGAHMLRAQGYRFIVVHEALYPDSKRDHVTAILDGLFGEPQRGDGVAVYHL